jgi:hypothetical protein
MDPMNLVPVGKAGSLAGDAARLIPGTLGHALGGAEQVVVKGSAEAERLARTSASGQAAADLVNGITRAEAPKFASKAGTDAAGNIGYHAQAGADGATPLYSVVKNGKEWDLMHNGEAISSHPPSRSRRTRQKPTAPTRSPRPTLLPVTPSGPAKQGSSTTGPRVST